MSDTYKQKIQQQYQKLICYFKEFNNICWSHKELFYMWWGIWIRESEFELGGGGGAVEILNRLILLFSFIFSLEISLLHLVFIFFKFKI